MVAWLAGWLGIGFCGVEATGRRAEWAVAVGSGFGLGWKEAREQAASLSPGPGRRQRVDGTGAQCPSTDAPGRWLEASGPADLRRWGILVGVRGRLEWAGGWSLRGGQGQRPRDGSSWSALDSGCLLVAAAAPCIRSLLVRTSKLVPGAPVVCSSCLPPSLLCSSVSQPDSTIIFPY